MQVACLSAVALTLLLGIGASANAGTVTAGTGSGVPVRGGLTFTNNTGEEANDFHIEVFQKENNISVNGVAASSSAFSGGSATLGDRDRNPVGDGKNHQANIDLNGGSVAAGDSMRFDVTMFLTDLNMLLIDEWYWTKDGQQIGGKGHPAGWQVGNPKPGGGGGGGPGQGGQEGNGGTGNYRHRIDIFNLGDKEMQLTDVRLLASMTNYSSLDDIDWSNVGAVADDLVLAAGEAFTFFLETTGSYLGGHVYLSFAFDDPILFLGDHPVTSVPEPATWALLGLGAALAIGRRRAPAAHARR